LSSSGPFPPVLLQWPAKAASEWQGNLATVQGGLKATETPLGAMRREVARDYRLRNLEIHQLHHRQFVSKATMKEYVWFFIQCYDHLTLVPNRAEVAETAWYYCPQTLFQATNQMNQGKARMFREVFALACEQHPKAFGDYPRYIERFRKKQARLLERQALARHLQTA